MYLTFHGKDEQINTKINQIVLLLILNKTNLDLP